MSNTLCHYILKKIKLLVSFSSQVFTRQDYVLMDKKFIEEIKNIRKALGLSQKDLAKSLGWHQTQVSKLESGNRKDIDITSIKALGDVLNVDIEHMIKEYLPDKIKNKKNMLDDELVSVRSELTNLLKRMPIEIPTYLQRSDVHEESTIIHYEYSANKGLTAADRVPIEHNAPISVKGVVNECYYDYPRTDPTDLLIVNKTITPIDTGPEAGVFYPHHWSKYTRVLIRTKKTYNGYNIHPALYIGHGKVYLKPTGKQHWMFDFVDYDLVGVIVSRRVYMEVSKVGSVLESRYGISKKNSHLVYGSSPPSPIKYNPEAIKYNPDAKEE